MVQFRRTPTSTYRLQFNKSFTFNDATAVVDYLHALGIGDCYASSYLTAVPGSLHGYDVTDPTSLNPEIGTEQEYWSWIDRLHARHMGHILDVVPNHMGIAQSANQWWQDVLENGPSSRFASFFDIEWHPIKDELADKLLIPILGDPYGAALESQALRLSYDAGAFAVRCYDSVLPVAPDTFPAIFASHMDEWLANHAGTAATELQSILTSSQNLPPRSSRHPDDVATRAREKDVVKRRLAALTDASPEVRGLVDRCIRTMNGVRGEPRSFDALDALLNRQSYRLAHWRVASEEINYRRFFDVNQLAALRMEDPFVFDEVHRFILELVKRGAATGLRIDHVDGLYDPAEYLQRLQGRCGDASGAPLYIVVEKILGRDERLPGKWPIAGTTGYEFGAIVNALFVDVRNERPMTDIARRFAQERRAPDSFADEAYRARRQVMHETMSGDINTLGHQLDRLSERNRHFRDFTLYSLIATLRQVIASFPVYRTYVKEGEASESDRRYIKQAVGRGRRQAPRVEALVFDFVERLLLKETPVTSPEEDAERSTFIGKFQQITGPIAAKGIEDTAYYTYNRLLSLNEVGSDPTRFGLSPATVHEWLADRQHTWPFALSTTSTHDTKRGEDVRARLNVLSEIPGAWKAAVSKWRAVNRRFKTQIAGTMAPDSNEEYLLYQTLVGSWPFEGTSTAYAERIDAYMIKALREAKVHTSWLSPDEPYESAVRRFAAAILDRRRAAAFLDSFLLFERRVAELGIYNGLSQLLVKITAPGVPDFYQGTELWDLNLVDPDNRRPVDYARRRRMLDEIVCRRENDQTSRVGELLASRNDGRIKMFVMMRALAARRQRADVFAGEYLPLAVTGARRESLFAFARRQESQYAITCVPRLMASVIPDATEPPLGEVWLDTRIELPHGSPASFRDALSDATVSVDYADGATAPTIRVSDLFRRLPLALLIAPQ